MQCAGTRASPGTDPRSIAKGNGFAGGNGVAKSAEPDQTQALLESEARYRTLFDLEPVAVYSCDAAGIIRQFNRRAAELWGREPAPGDTDERFCGSFKLFHPDGSFMPHEQCPMAEVISGKLAQVRDAEVLIERPDGSQIAVVVNIQPILGPHGEVLGAINCFFDVTERTRTEALSREFAAQLADADRRKSEFMAVLAHEFRSPLSAIRAALQVQRQSKADTCVVHSANELMERQVGHLVRLVDDLLDVNLISRGQVQLRRERVELASVVHAAVETTRSLIERMEHELVLAVPPEPIWVNADPSRLAQVLGNLLSNASKFTQNGGRIRLSVALRGEEAEIKVCDNGAGIDAARLPFVFDMFMQGEIPIDGARAGLGIGLALVKSLVELHDGSVEANSEGLGHGSEFLVRLPVIHDRGDVRVVQRHASRPLFSHNRPGGQ